VRKVGGGFRSFADRSSGSSFGDIFELQRVRHSHIVTRSSRAFKDLADFYPLGRPARLFFSAEKRTSAAEAVPFVRSVPLVLQTASLSDPTDSKARAYRRGLHRIVDRTLSVAAAAVGWRALFPKFRTLRP
jgi:hypothetical protein